MLSSPDFRKIYMVHAEQLVRQFYYKCGDQSLAEDLVQEAFLRLWKHRAKVTKDSSTGFLYTAANNLFLDVKKRERVQLRYMSHLPKEASQPDPSYELEEKEFAQQLEDYINRLSDDVRVTFLLNRIEKLTYREIAARLLISQKAVEKRMSKALLELRKLHPKI